MAKRITDHDRARQVRLNQKRARKAKVRREKKEKQPESPVSAPSFSRLGARDIEFLNEILSRR